MNKIYLLAEEYLKAKKESESFENVDLGDKQIFEKTNQLALLFEKTAMFLNDSQRKNQIAKIVNMLNGFEYKNDVIYFKGQLPRAMNFDHKNIQEVADFCMNNVSKAIYAIAYNGPTNESINHLCGGLFTLKTMLDSKDKMENDLKTLLENELQQKEKNSSLMAENCKQKMQKYQDELKREIEIQTADAQNGCAMKNKLVIAYKKQQYDKQIVDLLKTEFDFDIEREKEPIYLGLDDVDSNIAFLSTDGIFDKNKTNSCLRATYLKNVLNFDSTLQILTLSPENSPSNELGLKSYILDYKEGKLGNLIFSNTTDEKQKFDDLLGAKVVRSANIDDTIVEYNKKFEYAKYNYLVVYLPQFLSILDENEKINSLLTIMKDSKRLGIFFVIEGSQNDIEKIRYVQEYDKNQNNPDKDLCLNSFDMVKIDFDENVLNITSTEIVDYLKQIDQKSSKNNIFMLKDVMNNFNLDFFDENSQYAENDYYNGMSIPVGVTASGKLCNFVTNTKSDPFTMILGKTGSGKTSFIHALILSGGLKYSPQELEFYIADFKSTQGDSADFEVYRKNGKLNIPHVRFLSLNGSPENANDIVDKIKDMASKRVKKIADAHCADFAEYNKKVDKKDRLPQVYFIIDEYAQLIKNNKVYMQNTIDGLVKTLRTSGIGLILSGQDTSALLEQSLNQISNYITFYLGNDSTDVIKNALHITSSDYNKNALYKEYAEFLKSSKGKAVYRRANTESKVVVCFTGTTGSEEQAKYAEMIRNKCKNIQTKNQIDVSDSSLVNADLFLDEDASKKSERFTTMDNGAIIKDENVYNMELFVGMSKMALLPSAIKFTENSKGFMVWASKQRASQINANIVMAYLFETAGEPYKKVKYVAFDSSNTGKKTEMLKDLVKNHKVIEDRIDIVENLNDAYMSIIECENILRERKNPNSTIDKKTPCLLLIDDIDWIFDEDIISYVKLTKQKKNQNTSLSDKEVPPELLSELMNSFPDELAVLQDDNTAEIAEKASQRDLIGAVENLVKNGAKYNIFTIICSSDYGKLGKLSGSSVLESSETVLEDYSILKTKTVIGDIGSTCYLPQSSCTVRLFDYKNATKWWKNLEERLGK